MTSFRLAFKRLLSRPVLNLLLLVGLALSVALPTSIPMYTDAALGRILANQDFADSEFRPPFSYLFWYSETGPTRSTFDQVEAADSYMKDIGLPALGLPSLYETLLLETRRFRIFDTDSSGNTFPRDSATLLWSPQIEELTLLAEGRWPSDSLYNFEGSIEVAISTSYAQSAGLKIGDRFTLSEFEEISSNPIPEFDVAVLGIFEPLDSNDPKWLVHSSQLTNRIYVPRDVISEILAPQDPSILKTAAWYSIADPSFLTLESVDDILHRSGVINANLQTLLPGSRLTTSPTGGLLEFKDRAETLQRRLNAYSIPTLCLVLIFVMLVVSLVTDERRGELAVLRSRGATRLQLIGQVAVESGILSIAGVSLGLFLSRYVADGMGRTRTFLDMSGDPLTHLALNGRTWKTAAMVMLIVWFFQIVPAIGASKHTLVSHDEAATRSTLKPWWQSTSLDFVVVAVSSVTAYQMLKGQLDLGGNALEDPTTIFLPTTIALAVGLLILRILPWFLELGAFLLGQTSSIVALTAARRAARSPGTNHVPILLLIITVGLAVFTGSLARTLDLQLFDETYHQLGADWNVMEPHSQAQPTTGRGDQVTLLPRVLQTRETFQSIPGIDQATRVLSTLGTLSGSQSGQITFFGVEPDNFTDIAFFRPDYAASDPFPVAISKLASHPSAILVHPSLGLRVGDSASISLRLQGGSLTYRAVVVGYVSHFPTWYPNDQGPVVVGNLDYIFLQTDDPSGYEVWMSADQNAPNGPDGDLETSWDLLRQQSSMAEISEVMELPERQGVFGVLTFGFLGSIMVSMLGFFFATLFRVKRSTVELGILQALGLPPRRVAGMVIIELGLLIGTGIGAGLLTGLGLSKWLLERLLSDSGLTMTPQLFPEIDQTAVVTISGLLIALFILSSIALVLVLHRTKVFEALKLGENP